MFPNCPDALNVPTVPGALLSVKLISLKACPALRITFAVKSFDRVTWIWPGLAVNWALAASDPSEPVPVAEKVIGAAWTLGAVPSSEAVNAPANARAATDVEFLGHRTIHILPCDEPIGH
jgi:hypothetical protein